jgi:hypothetical protein
MDAGHKMSVKHAADKCSPCQHKLDFSFISIQSEARVGPKDEAENTL